LNVMRVVVSWVVIAGQAASVAAQEAPATTTAVLPAAPVALAAAPEAVLAWGRGLFRVELETGKIDTWLDASHEIKDVCPMQDAAGGAGTVLVLEHGQLLRLDAVTGKPVVVADSLAGDFRPVRSRQVLDLVRTPDGVATIESDRGPDGSGGGAPFANRYPSGPAMPEVAPDALGEALAAMVPVGPGTPLGEAPDRICFNRVLYDRGEAAEIFAALSPAQGLGPRLWNTDGEAPRPQPLPAEERWFVQGFAMATDAPRCFALMASPFSFTRLMAFDFPDGLASGTWTMLNTKPPVADPQIMSLYLCSSDGSIVLAGNGYRIDVIDGVRGGRRATLALQGIVRDSDSVLDLCLLSPAPGATSVCGLIRETNVHGVETGAMKLAAWDLATGALQRFTNAPAGVNQLTALGADTIGGAGPGAGPGPR